jgi:hypothetical protein
MTLTNKSHKDRDYCASSICCTQLDRRLDWNEA